MAFSLFVNAVKGLSSLQLSRNLGSGHESAFYALFVRTNSQPWLW
jgi:hypothetical protein